MWTAHVRLPYGRQYRVSLAAVEGLLVHSWQGSVASPSQPCSPNCWCGCPFPSVRFLQETQFIQGFAMQTMPGSAYMINLRFCPDGSPVPTRQPIPEADLQRHRQLCAHCSDLPSHVAAVHAPQPECTGACNICGSESEDDDVRLLTCASCRIMVHNTCYDCPVPGAGEAWLCEVCHAGVQRPPGCVLCPVLGGGAMRFTRCGQWAHAVCCLWIPGCVLNPGSPPCLEQV